MKQTIKKQSVNRADDAEDVAASEMVSSGLRKLILSGEIESGAQLRQEEIAQRFGTSRIPVREALWQLEAEGLILFHRNRGAVVTTLSLAEALDIMEIRIGLECRALKLAIPNMIGSDFDAARSALDMYDEAEEPKKWSDLNWLFHMNLYAPCDKPRLLHAIQSNYGHFSRFLRVQVSTSTGKTKPQTEHREILAACEQADVKKAVDLLEAHIVHTQKTLLSAERRKRMTTPQ